MNVSAQKQTKKQVAAKPMKAGETVSWESKASNVSVKKSGVILAFVPANTDFQDVLAKVPARSLKDVQLDSSYHRTGEKISRHDRYLVLVNKFGTKTLPRPLLYTPLASSLAGKKKK